MTEPDRLAAGVVAPGSGASFIARREGSLATIEPLTIAASEWLKANVSDDVSWLGDTLVVEMSFFPRLADAILAAGFLFERDALLN